MRRGKGREENGKSGDQRGPGRQNEGKSRGRMRVVVEGGDSAVPYRVAEGTTERGKNNMKKALSPFSRLPDLPTCRKRPWGCRGRRRRCGGCSLRCCPCSG